MAAVNGNGGPAWRHWMVLPALLIAFLIAASEVLRLLSPAADPIRQVHVLEARQPWGGWAARDANRQLEHHWREDPGAALDALDWTLRRYPLDADAWLLRTRLLRERQGLDEPTRRSMAAGLSVQPGLRELHWRALSLAEGFGDAELVADSLRRYIRGHVPTVDQALFSAARWFPDPGERLDRVLPDGQEYLNRAMRYAREQGLPELAEAVWQRLDQPRAAGDRVLDDYLRVQRAHGQGQRVLAALQTLDPAHAPGRLPGGDFSVSLEALGLLGWSLRMPAGVVLRRDEKDLPPLLPPAHPNAPLPPASLRLEFNGRENVRLNVPRVSFRPAAPGAYRLVGWWKAERLTTRALPYLDIRLTGTRVRRRLELPAPDFEWQQFTLDLDIDETRPQIQVSVMRSDTEAFDRYIGGSLSLAGLRLEPRPTGSAGVRQ